VPDEEGLSAYDQATSDPAALPEEAAPGERAGHGDVDFESIVAFDASFKKG